MTVLRSSVFLVCATAGFAALQPARVSAEWWSRAPVDVVPSCEVGLFTMISMIPSGTSVNVAFHANELVPAPDTRAGSGFATVPQFTFVIDGVPPFPELDTLNEIEFVIESQLIGTLNSRLMSTVVAFVSPDSA